MSDSRTVTYAAFDKPTQITKGGNTATFTYGPDRKRYKRVDNTSAGITTTTYIGGGSYEQIITGLTEKRRHYIGDFAVVTDTETNTSNTRVTTYLHRDHLGSVDAITDHTGTITQRMSFDAWGKRREVNWQPGGQVGASR